MCVDCQYRGDFETEFVDQGGRGTFCKDKASCNARLLLLCGRSRAAAKVPTGEHVREQVRITQQAMLRQQPHLDAPTNGVEVDVGEVVDVLAHPTLSTCGISFLYILAHKRKGYIRQAYCSK